MSLHKLVCLLILSFISISILNGADIARGQLVDISYPSALNKQDIPIKIYLPPGYENGNAKYPVVYNFHGGGGTPERQWDRTRKTLTDAMENKRVRPMIYVFINGLGNTEFVNTVDGKMIERSIIEELIPFIDSKYRTINTRQGRLADGFSMGGYGCLSVVFRNPDKFTAVCSYGAAVTIKKSGRNYRDSLHFAEHNPWDVVVKNADQIRSGVRVRMVCGDGDGLFPANVSFTKLLDSLKIPVDFVPVEGVAHCTQCLYEEVGLESLKFFEETLEFASKGLAMNIPVKRVKPEKSQAQSSIILPFKPQGALPKLRISDNKRFLVTEDGRPFFWLGDTGWMLFQNLDREEVDKYFEDRASKQFSVVLAHILPWEHGQKNIYNDEPFIKNNFLKPNENYWKHADYIVKQAQAKGLYIGILPMWALNYIDRKDGKIIINKNQALAYGKFLGKRYGANNHVFWVLGGDVAPKRHDIYDALAKGIVDGSGLKADDILITYHPPSNVVSTGEFYPTKSWMDFNMIQSGHDVWRLNYKKVEADYNRLPVKPTLETEANYENHPIFHDFKNGVFNSWHVRIKSYWSVFAGGFGITYGGNGIWQMDKEGRPVFLTTHANLTWDKALDLEGAHQMKYLRRLIESRPFLSRIPDDNTVIINELGEKENRIQVTRDNDRTWAMYYLTIGQNVEANVANLKGPKLKAWWFNPRDGKTYDNDGKQIDKPFGIFNISDKRITFNPPGEPKEGDDWVLVLDNIYKNYPIPGDLKLQNFEIKTMGDKIVPTNENLIDIVDEDFSKARHAEFKNSKGGPENNIITNFSIENVYTEDTAATAGKDAKTTTKYFARGGKTAFKFYVNNKGERAELAMAKTEIGKTYWYGWSMMLPNDFDFNGHYSIVMQLAVYPPKKDRKFKCGAVGSYMEISPTGKLIFKLQRQGDTEDVACDRFVIAEDVSKLKGKWIDFVMNVKWTGDKDGFLKFWMKNDDNNFLQKINYTGATFWNDEDLGPYFKMGLYLGDPNWKGPNERILFADEYRLGNEKASFNEVAPPGAQSRLDEAKKGIVQYITYPSKLNNMEIPIMVYTPPGYDPNGKSYPVIYNLHGAGGGSPARQWDRVQKTLTKAIDEGVIKPVIYVFVNGLGDNFYMDLPDSISVYSSIINELIPFIDSNYKTIANKSGRAIDGFSMGGCGALMVAMKSPELFSAVVSYGAAVVKRDSVNFPTKNRFKTREQLNKFDVWSIAPSNANAIREQLKIRMVCGDEDGLYNVNIQFRDLLASLNIPVEWVSIPGIKHDTKRLFDVNGIESLKFIEKAWELNSK